jgi:hypothetical protein
MKLRPDALETVENEYGDAKHENGTRRPRYRGKRVRERMAWKRDPTPSEYPKMSTRTQNMKTILDAHGTTENESRSVRHENRSLRPRHRRKRVRESKAWKRDPTPSEEPKMSPGAQRMETGLDALRTAENDYGYAKHGNGTRHPRYRRKCVRERKTLKQEPTPTVPSKTSLGAQSMQMGTDALGTFENESGSAKHENGNRRPPHRRKRVRKRKT